MIGMNSQGEELRVGLNLVTEIQSELEIKILENAPRNADKLRGILKVKQRQTEEETMYIGDIEGLGDEIEMLKVVLN
jgi:DNA-directed RNA polymerase subunit F